MENIFFEILIVIFISIIIFNGLKGIVIFIIITFISYSISRFLNINFNDAYFIIIIGLVSYIALIKLKNYFFQKNIYSEKEKLEKEKLEKEKLDPIKNLLFIEKKIFCLALTCSLYKITFLTKLKEEFNPLNNNRLNTMLNNDLDIVKKNHNLINNLLFYTDDLFEKYELTKYKSYVIPKPISYDDGIIDIVDKMEELFSEIKIFIKKRDIFIKNNMKIKSRQKIKIEPQLFCERVNFNNYLKIYLKQLNKTL